jgi:hypothetical protein
MMPGDFSGLSSALDPQHGSRDREMTLMRWGMPPTMQGHLDRLIGE